MQDQDNRRAAPRVKKKKKTGKLRVAVNMIVILLTLTAVIWLISNREEIGRVGIKGLLSNLTYSSDSSAAAAGQIYFDVGYDQCFASFNGGLAVASASSLSLYSASGEKRLSAEYSMGDPALCSAGLYNLVFDRGGKSYYLTKNYTLLLSANTNYDIINARMSEQGWYLLISGESEYKALVSVFDNSQNEVYKWYSADQYVMSADISPDCTAMVCGCVSADGAKLYSRIIVFSLSEEQYLQKVDLEDTLLLDVFYTAQGNICAVTEGGLYFYNNKGESLGEFSFNGAYLKSYAGRGLKNPSVLLGPYRGGGGGSLSVIDEKGQVVSHLDIDDEVTSLSAAGDYIALLYADDLKIYKGDLTPYTEKSGVSSYRKVIQREDGSSLLIGEENATVFTP